MTGRNQKYNILIARGLLAGFALAISGAAQASHSAYTYLQSYGYHPAGHNLTSIPVATLNERVDGASIDNQIVYQGWQPDPWGKPLYSDGYARGYADLATGKVGAYAGGNAFAQTRAMAGWQDNLVFKIDGATNDTYTSIIVKVRFDGELFRAATEGGYQQGAATSYFTMVFGQGGYVDTKFTNTSMFMQTSGNDIQILGGGRDWDDFSYASEGTSVIMTGTYRLRGAAPRVAVSMGLDASARGNAFANFLHTAAFDMVLPDHVTYESSSGVFLSQAAAVPEPSTWLLMIAGFGAVAMMMRATRKSARLGLLHS